MKNRVGIMTYHYAHNFGAMLQSYSLCKVINDLGFQCEIIDYRLPYIDQYVRKERITEVIEQNGIVIGILKYVKRLLTGQFFRDKQWKSFETFYDKYLHKSLPTIVEKNKLVEMDYDIYVSGSDQIWNLDLNGYAWEYFLDFVPDHKKKIAYAASNGKAVFSKENSYRIKTLLSKYNFIGIRESKLTSFITNQYNIAAQTVLDPTLLIDKSEWKRIVNRTLVKYNNYVFIYLVEENEKLLQNAIQYSKKQGKNVVVLAYNKINNKDIIQIKSCNPFEFVSLICNSEMVITNSYHGLCFSLIMEKSFYVFSHSSLNERIHSLLSLLGLLERQINEEDEINNNCINYEEVNELIKIYKKKSIDFLREALSNE